MVGMPFANMHSPELAERMKYVRELAKQSGSSSAMPNATSSKVADPVRFPSHPSFLCLST